MQHREYLDASVLLYAPESSLWAHPSNPQTPNQCPVALSIAATRLHRVVAEVRGKCQPKPDTNSIENHHLTQASQMQFAPAGRSGSGAGADQDAGKPDQRNAKPRRAGSPAL